MREIKPAAEGVHLNAVEIDERVVRLSAARKDARQGADASRTRDGQPGNLPERVGDGCHLAIAQLRSGNHRYHRRRFRLRYLHLRCRHHERFRHGRDRKRDRADVARSRRGLIGDRIGPEAIDSDSQLVSTRVGREHREFATRISRRCSHGRAARDKQHTRPRNRPVVRIDDASVDWTG